MQLNKFKILVEEILSSDVKLDGHISKVLANISNTKLNHILIWLVNCKLGVAMPYPCKNYPDQVAFIYKSSDNRIRGILTKKKNSYFIELFLDKHKYYDRKRKYLGL